MALAIALTGTPLQSLNYSQMTVTYVVLTFDNNYPLGGYSVTPAQLGLSTKIMEINSPQAQTGGYFLVYDTTNTTIRVFNDPAATGAFTEVTSASAVLNGLAFNTAILGW